MRRRSIGSTRETETRAVLASDRPSRPAIEAPCVADYRLTAYQKVLVVMKQTAVVVRQLAGDHRVVCLGDAAATDERDHLSVRNVVTFDKPVVTTAPFGIAPDVVTGRREVRPVKDSPVAGQGKQRPGSVGAHDDCLGDV